MYEVEIVTGFSAAHRLREYKGKCEHLHGHNYRVHVVARSVAPGPGGMVIDFGDLKKAANVVMVSLDHAYLNDIPPFDVTEPSAENIAKYIFDRLQIIIPHYSELLHSVSVWESDTSRASFIRD